MELIVLKESDCFEGGFIRDILNKTLVPYTKYVESPSWKYFRSKCRGISTEFPNESFDIDFEDDIAWLIDMHRGTHGNTDLYRRNFDELFFSG